MAASGAGTQFVHGRQLIRQIIFVGLGGGGFSGRRLLGRMEGLVVRVGIFSLPFRLFGRIIFVVYVVNGEKPLSTTVKFDEGSLQGRLHPGNAGQIDVTFDLFPGSGFYVKIDQPLVLDHRHANLFCVGGVHQHALGHCL